MIVVELPFPDVAKLSMNARSHWLTRHRLAKVARRHGWAATLAAMGREPVPTERPLPVRFSIHAPDKRRRDHDNIVTALKSYCDGIADAIGVDDADWAPEHKHLEVIKGGKVIVQIGVPP